jgi:microcompartment protein CcmK/EutM
MKQGKIIGRVFCSVQTCDTDGKALLLVQPLDWDNNTPCGGPLVAADCVGSGAGETVFFVQARDAIIAFEDWKGDNFAGDCTPPVDAAVVGIVDGKTVKV